MSVVPSQSYASVGVPLFHPTSTPLPPGPTGPAGPSGPTGPAGSGGGGFTPAGGQYNWNNAFPAVTSGSTSMMAGRNPQTTQSIGGMAYSGTNGVFSATGTNTGRYFVTVNITWTCVDPYQFVPFQLRYGTSIPGNVVGARTTARQLLGYEGTFENGDPALYPAYSAGTQTVLTGIIPLLTNDTTVGLYANVNNQSLTIEELTWTLHRIA